MALSTIGQGECLIPLGIAKQSGGVFGGKVYLGQLKSRLMAGFSLTDSARF